MSTSKNSPIHALIVEDNRDLARLFSDLLEVLGCTADTVWSAQSGVERAISTTPDLIFCDLSMPGEKDGFDVAREIRAKKELAGTWLIAVTGYDSPDTYARAMEAGFDRVFPKPLKFAQIQSVLTDLKNGRENQPRPGNDTPADSGKAPE